MPVAGFAAQYRYNDNWFINFLADLGGWSDSATGQVLASVGYNWTPSIATTLGYRVMYTYTIRTPASTSSPSAAELPLPVSGCTGLSPASNTASDPTLFRPLTRLRRRASRARETRRAGARR